MHFIQIFIEVIRCQECGFKNPDGKKNCEKCGSVLFDLSSANFNPDALRVNQPSDAFRTIKVIKEDEKEEVEQPKYNTQPLSALSFDDEEKKKFFLINEKTGEKLHFESADTLKRENVAPNNASISDTEHANIYWENGSWCIKDLSTNGATFVQAKDVLTLRKGMRIIIGNQIFRFEE